MYVDQFEFGHHFTSYWMKLETTTNYGLKTDRHGKESEWVGGVVGDSASPRGPTHNLALADTIRRFSVANINLIVSVSFWWSCRPTHTLDSTLTTNRV
jgi:hypothetical protein